MPPHVVRSRLRPAKGSETLVSSMADECLQTEPYCVGIGRRPTCLLGGIEQFFVDIERFLHMAIYTIQVWHSLP